MIATVNQKGCVRCGLCAAACPEVFAIAPGESARAITGEVPDALRGAVGLTAERCPTGAIEIK